MTNEQLTARVMEHGERLSKCEADDHELFNRVKALEHASAEHGKIVESIHELALSMRDVKSKVNDIDERVEDIENDRRQKSHAIWQIVVSAILGGALTFLVTTVLGGA